MVRKGPGGPSLIRPFDGRNTARPLPGTAAPAGGGQGRAGDHRNHFEHGVALMRAGNFPAAAAALDKAVGAAPNDAQCRMAFGVALMQSQRLDDAIEAFRRAVALQPGDATAHNNLGFALTQKREYAAALDALRRATELKPKWGDAHFNLGNAERLAGDTEGAKRSYRRALALQPDHLGAFANLAGLLLDSGLPDEARPMFEQALKRHPDRPELLFGFATAARLSGDLHAAADAYRRLDAKHPDNAEILNNLGSVLADLGQRSEAIACYERALARMPGTIETTINLGAVYAQEGRRAEARAMLLRIAPDTSLPVPLRLRLGAELRQIGELSAAIAHYQAALVTDPGQVEIHRELGIASYDKGAITPALEHLDYALASGDDDARLLEALGLCRQALGHYDEALDLMRRAVAGDPASLALRSTYLLALNYSSGLSADAIAAEHRRIVDEWLALQPDLANLAPSESPRVSRAGRKLRIGYYSSDFRLHSCAFFIEPLFEGHDRSDVEVFCYTATLKSDDVTTRLKSLADHWRDITTLDDAAAAHAIACEDAPDILVDLAGHTGVRRLGIFARRPAPIQVSWLGYPNTTALPAIGYRITDSVADPPGAADAHCTEKLLRIDGGFLAYRPLPSCPDPMPGPSQRGLPLAFGCFNNPAKLSSTTIALWCEILARIPHASLVLRGLSLADKGVEVELRRRFEAGGLATDRLRILNYANTVREALTDYGEIDIALDPMPYNGTTTTCEALWMGVPVVTLAGDRHAARVGASLLHHAGLGDRVAETPADYVDLAVQLGNDPARLAELRPTLRSTVAASPLGDGKRLAREFETIFDRLLSQGAL
jgi:protein O-GlcNAc transferase